MFGRPTRAAMRPEYLSDSYMMEGSTFLPQSAATSVMGPMMQADPMGLDAMDSAMMVSALPPEGEKDNNFARLFGVSLLLLSVGLAMRK